MKRLLQTAFAAGGPALLGLIFGIAIIVTQLPGNKAQSHTEEKSAATTASSSDASAAASTVKSTCSSCHGADLKGAFGPNLHEVAKKLSEQQIEDILKNGKGQMPRGLVPGKEAEVAKYIKSLAN